MNTQIQYPLTTPHGRLRRMIKVLIGSMLCLVCREREGQLLAGSVGERLDLRDRLMIAALLRTNERRGTVDRLAPLQTWLWRSGQAVEFHRQAEARFQTWWLEGASALVTPLQQLIDTHPAGFSTLCEIGCGSGLVLENLSQRMPAVPSWLGLDLSPQQVRANRTRFAGRGLRFVSADAALWIPKHAAPGWIYFTNAGVLEYFPEGALRTLLQHIADHLGPAALAIAEPIEEDFDPSQARRSQPFGAERTFSHPYLHLLAEHGWQLRWHAFGRIDGFRYLMALATTGLATDTGTDAGEIPDEPSLSSPAASAS